MIGESYYNRQFDQPPREVQPLARWPFLRRVRIIGEVGMLLLLGGCATPMVNHEPPAPPPASQSRPPQQLAFPSVTPLVQERLPYQIPIGSQMTGYYECGDGQQLRFTYSVSPTTDGKIKATVTAGQISWVVYLSNGEPLYIDHGVGCEIDDNRRTPIGSFTYNKDTGNLLFAPTVHP